MLRPDYMQKSVQGVTLQFLKAAGIGGLIVDIDNTLAKHDDPTPAPGAREWVEAMRAGGIKLCIISNNGEERVRPFAQLLGLPYVHSAKKPLPKSYRRAVALLGLPREACAMVGDQLFTDRLGGNIAGVKTILVNPIDGQELAQIQFKRKLERLFIKREED